MSTQTTTTPPAPAGQSATGAQPEESQWRGVAAEHRGDDLTTTESGLLKDRSRRLLGSLLRPHKKVLKVLLAIVLLENAARLSIPYLVKEGIDRGIPPIQATGDTSTLWTIVALVFAATVVQAISRRTFLVKAGRIGQDMTRSHQVSTDPTTRTPLA